MDSREDVLRAADILRDADVPIERAAQDTSGRHFFLYASLSQAATVQVGAGGYLIFDPDWTHRLDRAERSMGRVGLQTVSVLSYARQAPVPVSKSGNDS